jgi:hypothetical protein
MSYRAYHDYDDDRDVITCVTLSDTRPVATYLRSTLDKINFAGVDKDKIWELRDFGFVAPAFQP